MNREILFKAKRKDWKKLPKENWWVEGDLIQNNFDGMKRMWISSESFDRARLRSVHKYITEWRAIEIDPDTICQYTGITDKNGKKIWENDIAHIRSSGLSGYGVIKYENGNLVLVDSKRKRTYSLYGEWKIRKDGNIFDNADLLEVE